MYYKFIVYLQIQIFPLPAQFKSLDPSFVLKCDAEYKAREWGTHSRSHLGPYIRFKFKKLVPDIRYMANK